MPKKRQPKEIWYGTEDAKGTRQKVWERDKGRCVRCDKELSLYECHIDHTRSGKLGTNAMSNLRTLCRRCHVLRADMRHRGMIASALRDGVIDENWRSQVWEDEELTAVN